MNHSGMKYSLAGLAMLLCFAASSQAAVQQPVITGNVQVKPVTTLSAKESRVVSLAAAEFLNHVEQARLALQTDNPASARKHIDQALKLSRIIQDTLPTYKVTTDISAKGTHYSNSELTKQRFVKVVSDSSMIDVISPIRKAQKGHQEADMDQTSMSLASITLDSLSADNAIKQAQLDLKEHHDKAALNDLETMQRDSVDLVMADAPVPLLSAVDNLSLAENEISNKAYEGALQTLKAASNNLKNYEAMSDDHGSKTVQGISEQIDQLISKANMENDAMKLGKLMDRSRDDVHKWWAEADGWMHHHI